MDHKACPWCGSLFFVTGKSGPKVVFHVTGTESYEIIARDHDHNIDADAIFCGACSWHGNTRQLVESR